MTPIVEKALNAVTIGTNLRTGLSYPSDRYRAEEMFIRLRNAGETLSSSEIAAWAKQNGWQAKDADELGALGERIGRGDQVNVPDGPWWNKNVLDLLMQNVPISRNTRFPIEC